MYQIPFQIDLALQVQSSKERSYSRLSWRGSRLQQLRGERTLEDTMESEEGHGYFIELERQAAAHDCERIKPLVTLGMPRILS